MKTNAARCARILDKLDMPEGFGFILRTAGFDASEAELKRDLNYLKRLWKDMERRRKGGNGPRLLYAESDLLVRTVRDELSHEINRVVIDNDMALRRVSAFFKIAAPRATTKLHKYAGGMPIMHAFGIEEQLEMMHARDVPLPSGGRLVIDQTEALVAIDVNSGRSRSAKDAEQNAFETNMEAVDEICRQLRLRDQGGLVICDLIDMRASAHRKKVEQRFEERLGRDKAKSTILPISRFGILEMTRQRMRSSFEQQHFYTCPMCEGRGLVPRPDSVASRALLELSALLDFEKIARIELAVGSRVAGALIGVRRSTLGRIERRSGKPVDVMIREKMDPMRYALYAYDKNGNDIDLERLPKRKPKPKTVVWKDVAGDDDQWAADLRLEAEEAEAQQHVAAESADVSASREHEESLPAIAGEDVQVDGETGSGKKKRRRRRRKKGDAAVDASDVTSLDAASDEEASSSDSAADSDADSHTNDVATDPEVAGDGSEGGKKKRRRRRRRRRSDGDGPGEDSGMRGESRDEDSGDSSDGNGSGEGASQEELDADGSNSKGKKRRRRRKRGGGDGEAADATVEMKPASSSEDSGSSGSSKASSDDSPAKKKPRRRSLYGSSRRSLAPSEKAAIAKKKDN